MRLVGSASALAFALLAACHFDPTVTSNPAGGDDQPPSIDARTGDSGSGSGSGSGSDQGDAGAAFDPTAGVEWFDWPSQQGLGDPSWGLDLTDIADHLPSQYGNQYWDSDAMTAGHETTHGIQAHLRNYETPASIGWNAFYVLGDKAAFVQEPNMRKSDVNAFVPASLRGSRYDTYLVGQTEWDDTPLYLFDEWSAYCSGAAVATDQVEHSLYTAGWTDAVMGPLEFSVYAIAEAKAVSVKDPAYFASNDQFKRFTAWQLQRAMQLYATGSVMTEFEWDTQDQYLAALRTSPDAADLRQFARDTWGDDWVHTTFGF